ncbi:hypothetical protein KC19_6G003600 [Ceratodon purpureus]|uniref:TF-B3 domain-containing protein n=1 Tax=Ceratodon purpureus TaxID=3225 RepID=A0A8T0HAB7_CERPU|nr:hypothetical protein KC19_6G003600 [Ceratodon purpureus]
MALVKCVQDVQDVQRSVSFERILTATCVPSDVNAYPRLTLPSLFVRQHADKIRLSAILQSKATSRRKWTVQIVVRHPEKNPQVMFYGGGWKDFAAFNGLVEGDRLTFTLTAMSEFEVSISDDAGDLRPVPWPRKRSKRNRVPERVTNISSPGRIPKIRDATVKKLKHDVLDPGFKGKLRLKCTAEEEESGSASDSSISKLPQVSSLNSHHDADPDLMVVYQKELTVVKSFNTSSTPWNSIQRNRYQARESWIDLPRMNLQKSLPSFVKQLQTQHVHRMEIPRGFYRTYGKQLQADVKLQGIHDGSPVRAVTCRSRSDGKNLRIELTDGWKEFNLENSLYAGQKFVFTLTAYSFFEVRRVCS